MNKNIEKIKELIIDLGERDWVYHISPVYEYSMVLAKSHGADCEVVASAAILHDIGRLKFGPKNHEKTGLPEAEKILQELGYPMETVKKILECIENHGVKRGNIPNTLEAKIIATADGRAHLMNFVEFIFSQGKPYSDFSKFLPWLEEKADHAWNEKIFFPETKKELKNKYDAIKELLSSYK